MENEVKNKIEVLEKYKKLFGELPMVPFVNCSGIFDEKYLDMIQYCVDNKIEATNDVYDIFFKSDEDVLF